MAAEAPLPPLVAACEAVTKLPVVTEAEAASFLEQQPLEAVFRLLSQDQECSTQQLDTICTALTRVLATQAGTALLPAARPYAEAALASPQHRLRRLGCLELGRLLLLLDAGGAAAAASDEQQQEQQQQLVCLLISALKDEDTGVAGEAERALVAHVAAHPGTFAGLLSGSTPAGAALQQQLADDDSSSTTHRMRAFALLAAAAAAAGSGGGAAAEQLRASGVVTQLLAQLSPTDPLSSLVALQLLQELVPHLGGAAAQLVQGLLLPALLPLLDEPSTAAGAFPIAAQLVAAAVPAAAAAGAHPAAASPMEVDGAAGGTHLANGLAAAANGNGVAHAAGSGSAADALLSKMAAVLDDRGSAGVDEELVVLDAAHHLALPSPEAAALLAAPAAGGLLASICSKALGRTTSPEVRLAALHALASAAGLERAGEARDRSAALLPRPAEEALRQGVYGAVAGAAGGVGGARSPAEAVLQLLQQPFVDMRAAVYRCCAALALHAWFAVDACNNGGLMMRLCTTDSESGQQACEWRHSCVMALWATVQDVLAAPAGDGGGAGGPQDAQQQQYRPQLTQAAQQQLAGAVRGGPYGAGGGRSTQQSHFVATAT